MSFLIKDKQFFKKCNKIWGKFSSTTQKISDSEAAYNGQYVKKTKPYGGKINTEYYRNKVPKEFSHCICSSVIGIDSVYNMNKNYYPKVFLEECKYK